jgi:hypothetical protein
MEALRASLEDVAGELDSSLSHYPVRSAGKHA